MTRRRSIWERLNESTEGPTVTISIPREWAEQLMQSLMQSLEIEDGGDEGMEGDDDLAGLALGGGEDDDEMAGPPGMDSDDDAPAFTAGEDDEDDFAAGDDDDEDDDSDDDEEEDDDDDKDEAVDFAGSDRNVRPKTALGESSFAKLAMKLGRRPAPRRRR